MSTPDLAMSRRARALLTVLCGAIFLEGIDVAMLNVALPSIRTDLGLAPGSLHWVVSAYVLGYGGFMLLGGRTADLLGRRRMFLIPLVVFLLFSGLGGLATEGWMLIVARFVTGVAAAFMTPAGLSIITTSFPAGPQRNKALLFYSGTAAGGFSLGLVIGGLLTAIDWRWVFFAPVLLAGAILLIAVRLVERDPVRDAGARPSFDMLGAVTVTAAMLLIIFAVTRLEQPAGNWGSIIGTFAAGLALLAAFIAIERRSAAPLVRLGIFRAGPLARANVSALFFAAGFFGFQFLVTLYLQDLRGWTSMETSLALLAVGVDAILAPTLTPLLVNRFGNAKVIFGGLCLAALSYALFLPVGPDWSYAAMFPTMILLGLAFSLAYGPLTIVATDGVKEEEQGLAGGLLYTSFQFGAALGLSMVTIVKGAAGGTALDGFHAALVVPLVTVVLAAVVTACGLRTRTAKVLVATSASPDLRGGDSGAGRSSRK